MWELIAGLFVALAALALVLEPVATARVRGTALPASGVTSDDSDLEDLTESDSPKIKALLALREVEFDRATGKLSEEDYVKLKARFESDAIAAIKAEEAAAVHQPAPPGERAEAAIRRAREQAGQRVCLSCGLRPEANAVYCSNCGRSLVAPVAAARCPVCGAGLRAGAKFCAECGGAIAA
jgi:hypothetical protein